MSKYVTRLVLSRKVGDVVSRHTAQVFIKDGVESEFVAKAYPGWNIETIFRVVS